MINEGNWIETLSGKRLALPNPDLNQIDIQDIAHALAYQPRFAGHTRQFYSVGEHSINVARLVPRPLKLQALLHDATEAYLCDIPTPFKALLPQYKELEQNLWVAIAARFDVPNIMHKDVKAADGIMLMTERDYLKPAPGIPWGDRENIPRWDGFKKMINGNVKTQFLNDFEEYRKIA